MTEKQMESIANEWGFVKASDYQTLKNQIRISKRKNINLIAQDKELCRLIHSINGRLMALKRDPKNMARPQKKKEVTE